MNSELKILYDKNLQKNNSSFLTAENTSTVQSNIKNSFNKSRSRVNLKKMNNLKYLNSTIFTHPHKNKSRWIKYSHMTLSPNTSKDNIPLYLTEAKNVIIPTYQSKTRNKYINYYKNKKNKNKLPVLKCFSHRNSEIFPDIFTCGDFKLKPKLLAKLYYKQNKKETQTNKDNDNNKNTDLSEDDENKKKKKKETTREYVYNANKRNFLKYCINNKKEALDEYKRNMKSQLDSLNYTISKIKNYKENLENIYFVKYNEEKKEFAQEIKQRKNNLDIQKDKILSLLKEVAELSQAIIKKQTIKKNYDKWLFLQVLAKEGSEPKTKNIKKYIERKYGKTEIFEKYNDFFINFSEKEQNNVRLLAENEKLIVEKEKLEEELESLTKNYNEKSIKNIINIKEKEKILKILKIRNQELIIVKNIYDNDITNNNKERKMKISKSLNNYHTSSGFNIQKYKDISIEKDLKINPLGVYYYNFEKVKDVYKMIYCIYNSILKNKIKGLNISNDIIYKIDNTLSNIQKALSQIKVIEFSLNYLKSSIKDKMKDKKCQKIIKEAKEQIDLYHKTIKAKLYEEEKNKKLSDFINKMDEKSKKVYFIPHKKFEKYPFDLFNKKKNESINKNNKKKYELFDFLYDDSFSDNENEKGN